MENNMLKNSQSILKSNYIIVENFSFKRTEILPETEDYSYRLNKRIIEIDIDKYKVSLSIKVFLENYVDIQLTISGEFEIKNINDDNLKMNLIKRNTISILFPYLRSQLSVITSQPGFKPIVLPAININALMEEIND